ncbi:cellulose binding domain-containing protein [Streptomyces sp. ACA25]|uniref:glucuronyl esterase domain-containing protein n=1 Tax=Streptomyces sp. ACA25 TaxID=3022596 RepID=UPI00230777DB|nr:cellulose binding domain-containing protein [Streptomyces sp. ACA25]MDB1090020.1 cellulose binding domain-containing protein [Streptomyces sp. ACA25]
MRFHRHRSPVWAAAAFAAVACLGAATLSPQAGAVGNPVAASQVASAEEDDGTDCPEPGPGTLPASPLLPDPFMKMDGTRISDTSEWRCRRAEIKKLAERHVYGEKPGKPDTVTGTVSTSRISVSVTDGGRSAGFSASVDLPSGPGPFPAVVVLGGFGADTSTIKASGAAVISYDPFEVGREGTPRNNKQGAFYSIYGSSSDTGLLMAWAWGVSRIIDVLEQADGSILRAEATGVTGCSRYGKGAFVSGAFDQRIALTMPIESGSAGAPVFRGVAGENGAQPLSSAYGEQPWLGDAFGSFTSNPAALPVDTHEIVGMVAPRGLFLMENPHVDWLGARSGSVAALGGAEVYKALGAGDNISYWSDIQDGTHCAARSEWRTPLQQHIRKYLLETGDDPGVFRISSSKSGNLAQWRDWRTPALTDTEGDTGGNTGGGTGGDTGGSDDGCTASYRNNNSWSGGFQGEVSVRNNGTRALNGWTVGMTLAPGQSFSNVWDGQNTGSSGSITVRNASWNGTVSPGATVSFGFVVTGSSSAEPGNLTCTTS